MSRVRETPGQSSEISVHGGSERAAFVGRLREIVRHWPSADRLARAVGVSPSAFRKWLKGEAEPSRERLVALADAAQVPIAWLAKGEGTPPRLTPRDAKHGAGSPAAAGSGVSPERFLILPRRVETAAAGAESPPPIPTAEYIAFRHDWIQAAFRVAPEDLRMELAVGESMQPTIRDGDLLLVDTTERSVGSFGIYVLELAGERLVKRVQRKVDGSLVLISDNPAYEPDTVSAELVQDLAVVGRVVWAGGAV
jgi:phage repressor protein C with HTH and peptisase S24 domain